jgi:hypothetical protein
MLRALARRHLPVRGGEERDLGASGQRMGREQLCSWNFQACRSPTARRAQLLHGLGGWPARARARENDESPGTKPT